MTPHERGVVFSLLDDYSRNKHQCFVAEFFLDSAKTKYHACFRPTGGSKERPRYTCRYLDVSFEQVAEAAEKRMLPASVVELLDRELPGLGGPV
jgi:hypothetical protein